MTCEKKIIIAIDGNSSSGKSTLAKDLAQELKYSYIDSGAMYRAVARFIIDNNIPIDSIELIENSLSKINLKFINDAGQMLIYLNGEDVSESIRMPEITKIVSEISTISAVRKKLVEIQQTYGESKGIVMDGRDIGTVVFPNAELKLFVTANIEVRSSRRHQELLNRNVDISLEDVVQNLKHRDTIDSTRKESPLTQADDAILLDTSHLSRSEQLQQALNLVKKIVA